MLSQALGICCERSRVDSGTRGPFWMELLMGTNRKQPRVLEDRGGTCVSLSATPERRIR